MSFLLANQLLLAMREFPKSVIFASKDDVSRTFLAVKSLCIIGGCLL